MEGHHLHCEVVLTEILLVDINIVIMLPKTAIKINQIHYERISIFDYYVKMFPNLIVVNGTSNLL